MAKLLLSFFFIGFSILSFGQNTLIYKGNEQMPNETTAAINPNNSLEMCVGANLNLICYSKDGGATWTCNKITSDYGFYGDPVLLATDSLLYCFHLSDPDGKNWLAPSFLDRIVVQTSTDFGKTWSTGVGIGYNGTKDQDKPWAWYNKQTKEVYVAWTEFDKYSSADPEDHSRILFSKTRDGATWSKPTIVSKKEGDCLDDEYTTEGAIPFNAQTETKVIWMYGKHAYINTSKDGLHFLKKEKKILDRPSGWEFMVPGFRRVNGLPSIANYCKNNVETFYLVSAAQAEKRQSGALGKTDVFVNISTSGGKKWSDNIILPGFEDYKHHFFPIISVDPSNGYIYVLYYEQANYTTNTMPVLAFSKDGGKQFKILKLAEAFKASEDYFLGDYLGLDAKDGKVLPVWMELHDGIQSIHTKILNARDL